MKKQEGFSDFNGYKTWYCIFGDITESSTPLIGLHGGPGWPHYSLIPLSELVEKGTPVILYDQLGCGKSDRPNDADLWTIELFIDELNQLVEHLGLITFNLLGHSWGGTLALEYIFAHPEKVKRLILNSPLLDTQSWIREADRLKDTLAPNTAAIMRKHESAGTTDDPEYKDAYKEFQQNFVCRIVPQPELHDKADEEWGQFVYNIMWGPSEAYATGSLKNYSALDRLHTISQPTLIISGKYDEATPNQMKLAQESIPDCDWLLLNESSHSSLFEEKTQYLDAVNNFLDSSHRR